MACEIFTTLLSFLKELLQKKNEIPKTMYKAKRTMFTLSLEYMKIYACPNDSILYKKEYERLSECFTGGLSRWKKNDGSVDKYIIGIPAKVLWYFPLIPIFRHMFH